MSRIHIVLVRTKYSRNIGSVSRTMGNMNGGRLILVDPKCDINEQARQGAAGAQEHLQNFIQYPSTQAFYESEKGLKISLTKRPGKRRALLSLDQQFVELKKENPNSLFDNIFLIFGPEDHGLSEEDMAFSHFRCFLKTYGQFGSMNLAHAALLAQYITQESLAHLAPSPTSEKADAASASSFPDKTLYDWLEATGFQLENKKTNAYSMIKRLLLKSVPTEKEADLLNNVLQQNIRKLTHKNM